MKTKKQNTRQSSALAVVVTGAGSGIGAECVNELVRQGYYVFLLGRRPQPLKKALAHANSLLDSRDLGQKSAGQIVTCDLQKELSIHQASKKVIQELKKKSMTLVGLVNNAGIYKKEAFQSSESKNWNEIYQTNFFGPLLLTQQLLPSLVKSRNGSIINISSTLGQRPVANTALYSSSKAAFDCWTKTLALELAPQNIRVNAIAPGVVETPIHEFFGKADVAMVQLKEQIKMAHPLRQLGEPADIATAVLFIMKSKWMTGAIIPIDGGIQL